MNKNRQQRLQQPPQPTPAQPPRQAIEIGQAALQEFSKVLVQHPVSSAQIVTLIEAVSGDPRPYRLVLLGARLVPDDTVA